MTIHYKRGYCDAIMGRECKTPANWQHAAQYLNGYLAAKQTGVIFFGAGEVQS